MDIVWRLDDGKNKDYHKKRTKNFSPKKCSKGAQFQIKSATWLTTDNTEDTQNHRDSSSHWDLPKASKDAICDTQQAQQAHSAQISISVICGTHCHKVW